MKTLIQIVQLSKAVCKLFSTFLMFAALTLAVLPSSQSLANPASNTNVVYQGRIVKPDGSPFEESNVQFTLQVYGDSNLLGDGTAGSDRCLLYQEIQTVDMSGSSGAFQLYLGRGSSPQYGSGVTSLVTIFRNPQTNSPAASEAIGAISCSSGQTKYLSSAWDNDREMSVTVTTSSTVLNLASMPIQAVPYAHQALQVGGYSSDYLMRVQSSRPGTANNFSANQFDFLLNLGINAVTPGTPSTYQVTNLLANDPTAAQQVATKNYVDTKVAAVPSTVASDGVTLQGDGSSGNKLAIKNLGVDTAQLKDASVTTAKLADGNVTLAKINQSGASSGDVLKWNGSAWVAATLSINPTGQSLNSTQIWVGNSSNLAAPVAMSGDATLSNAGALILNTVPVTKGGTGVTAYTIGQVPVYDGTKLTGLTCAFGQSLVSSGPGFGFSCGQPVVSGSTLTNGSIWVGNSSGAAVQVVPGGDVTMTNAGSFTVTQLQGRSVASTAPSAAGQALVWNGSSWGPSASVVASGTGTANYVTKWSNTTGGLTNSMIYDNGTTTGINTATPDSAVKLDVAGAIRAANNIDNGTSAVDFSTGNTQYTSSSCGSFTLKNLRAGGNYTFIVQGTTAATCSFTMYTDNGTTSISAQKFVPANGPTINTKSTIYNIQIVGTVAYVNWVPGF